jgi:hypothetical protein
MRLIVKERERNRCLCTAIAEGFIPLSVFVDGRWRDTRPDLLQRIDEVVPGYRPDVAHGQLLQRFDIQFTHGAHGGVFGERRQIAS